MLIQEGEEITATGLWFISKGECAVTRIEVPGWCRILGPGNHFGVSTILITYQEISLLYHRAPTATVMTGSLCSLLFLPKRHFPSLLQKFPESKSILEDHIDSAYIRDDPLLSKLRQAAPDLESVFKMHRYKLKPNASMDYRGELIVMDRGVGELTFMMERPKMEFPLLRLKPGSVIRPSYKKWLKLRALSKMNFYCLQL